MTELFAPAAAWQRLPQRYVAARRLGALVPNAVVTIVAALLSGFFLNWWWAGGVAAAGLFWTAWRVARAGRWVRAFGYAERDADLLITRGLWHKELTAVPYGRMLSVNVESGPLDRAWGLARVDVYKRQPPARPPARSSTSSTVGRAASAISLDRKYSCSDWCAALARCLSTACVSSGTSLI